MGEYRILGKSVQVRVTQGGVILSEISAIKAFTFETRQRIITEGYLGETAQRQDEIFDEVGGSFSVHPEGTDILQLQKTIADRARARTANPTQVSASFRVSFPQGTIARIVIPDMKFDPIPFNVSGRDAYVDMSFTYKATQYLLAL